MTRGLPIPEHHATFVVQVQENESASAKTSRGTSPSRTGTGDYRSSESTSQLLGRPSLYKPRAHYRIVFKEVCQCISDLRSLKSITEVLTQALIALGIMHKAGWVHRDNSVGNILFHERDGKLVVKLSDLEYAKQYLRDDKGAHEMRTGTTDFMAVEVDVMSYQFFTTKKLKSSAMRANVFDFADRRGPSVSLPELNSIPEFRYNPMHDIESIWWVLNWFVFTKSVVKVGGQPPSLEVERRGDYMKQQERAAALFYSSKARVTHIRAPREDVSDCLHEVMQPMARLIKATQRRMFDAYYSLEGDLASILKVVQEQAERLLLHFCGDFQLTLNSMENAEDIELGHIGEDPRRDLIPDATWAEFNVQSSDAPLKEGKRRMVDEDLDDEEMDEMRLIPQPGFSSAGDEDAFSHESIQPATRRPDVRNGSLSLRCQRRSYSWCDVSVAHAADE